MLSVRDVRRLLAVHGLAPRRQAGQNFVVDANTVRKVVRDAQVRPGELVCEVGAGLGSLTLALRAAGAEVVAVEIDAGLVAALHEVVAGDAGVRIVHADALALDLAELVGGGPAAFVANLPYHAATAMVLQALGAGVFERILVMVQREVGQRWVARPGHPLYSGVSVKIAALADARVVAAVSPRAFWPVPGVDSVTVRLDPRPWSLAVEPVALFRLVDAGFGQRRKRLRNALGSAGQDPAAVEAALAAVGLDAGARAEELDVEQWAALTAALPFPP